MKAFVINLDRAPKRRDYMRAQLDALGQEYEFFAAVDASRGQLEGVSRYDERLALWKLGHPLAPGELGCFASHYLLWQRCAELGEPILVLEDDIALAPGFAQAVALAAQQIGQRRMIRLCGLSPRPCRVVEPLAGGHELIRYLKGPFGTQAYALSPEGARALLRHAEVWIDAVDMYVDAFWEHGVPCYAIRPFHVTHDTGSTPASMIGDHRFRHKRPFWRALRRRITRLGHRLQRVAFNLRHHD